MKNFRLFITFLIIISASNFVKSQYTSATDVYTPNNTQVGNVGRFTGTDYSYSAAQIETLRQTLLINYGNAELYAVPTKKHNCHAFAWHVIGGGVPRWIGLSSYTAENVYWTDNSYQLVNTRKVSSLVSSFPSTPHLRVSYPETSNGNHSAVTTRQAGWFVSKWGDGPTVKHEWDECPYSDQSPLKYYKRASDGWDKQWSNYVTDRIDGHTIHSSDKFYKGDFDGDGSEELLCVQTDNQNNDDWITMLNYYSNDWHWGWSNYGNPSAGGGIYPYRHNLTVGDFDGDGKDELLGNATPNGWITMFHFENGNWQWGWSNYGNSHAINPYRDDFISGDFDGDGIDEILGNDLPSGWTTMFKYSNGNWQWGWSDYGNHAIRPYKDNLIAGDYDGDGKDEILGNDLPSGWLTIFEFNNNNFQWGWSDYGNDNGMRPYIENFVVGDFDSDNKDEILGFDPPNGWVTMFNYSSGSWQWGFSTYNNKRLNDWWFKDYTNDKCLSIEASGNNKDYLMLFKKHDLYAVNMYSYASSKSVAKSNEFLDNTNSLDSKDEINTEFKIFPNPAKDNFNILLNGNENYLIDIISINGKTVKHFNTSGKYINIDCSDFPEGMYIIKAVSSGKTQQQKVIISGK